MKKLISCILCSVFTLSLLSGCGNKSVNTPTKSANSDVTIKFAVFETANYTPELWKGIIDAFEKDNKNIKVEKVLMTGASRPQFLKTMLSAGNMPDINIQPEDLASMKDIYAEVPADLLSGFEDGAVAKFNGKANLVPSSKQLRVQTFYNKKMFTEAGITDIPKTWDDFTAACGKLKANGFTPLITAGAKDIWATSFGYFISVANAEVGDAYPKFNEDLKTGKVKFNNPAMVDSLKRWQELVKKGYYDKGSMSYGYEQSASEFFKGNAAMFMSGSWVAPQIDAFKDSEKPKFEIGSFPTPTINGVKDYSATYQYWGVSNTSKNKEAAFKFCKYVLGGNKDVYANYLKADGLLSVTKTPIDYPRGPMTTQFIKNFDGLAPIPEITKVTGDYAIPVGLEDFILKSCQNIYSGKDVEVELNKWDAEYKKLSDSAAKN